MSVYKDLHEL